MISSVLQLFPHQESFFQFPVYCHAVDLYYSPWLNLFSDRLERGIWPVWGRSWHQRKLVSPPIFTGVTLWMPGVCLWNTDKSFQRIYNESSEVNVHILLLLVSLGTIKDAVTRYAHQSGHHVSRRAGWDCHGLPVEYEIDQSLNITHRDQVRGEGISVTCVCCWYLSPKVCFLMKDWIEIWVLASLYTEFWKNCSGLNIVWSLSISGFGDGYRDVQWALSQYRDALL